MTLSYEDSRFGDKYVIEVDERLNFESATRYVDGQPSEPIFYESIYDISPMQRAAIENLIRTKQRSNIPK